MNFQQKVEKYIKEHPEFFNKKFKIITDRKNNGFFYYYKPKKNIQGEISYVSFGDQDLSSMDEILTARDIIIQDLYKNRKKECSVRFNLIDVKQYNLLDLLIVSQTQRSKKPITFL